MVSLKCAECGNTFEEHPNWVNRSRRSDQASFCSRTCSDKTRNRAALRGRQAVPVMIKWVSVGVEERGRWATLMGRLARGWRDEDIREGRQPMVIPESALLSERFEVVSYGLNSGRGRKANG